MLGKASQAEKYSEFRGLKVTKNIVNGRVEKKTLIHEMQNGRVTLFEALRVGRSLIIQALGLSFRF